MVKRDRGMDSLYVFFTAHFIAIGMSTFAPKFYGEIGLTDGEIGLITAAVALLSLLLQPAWGMLADRARYKKAVIALALAGAGLACFLVPAASGGFLPLLAVLCLYSALMLPANPVANAIAIEYTDGAGRAFGPVRMMGTVGYQVSILATGFLLPGSLMGLYPFMGIMTLLAALTALLLPNVRGYQHEKRRVPFSSFLKDRGMLLLFVIAFLANIPHQFNLAFFSKHLGDLGVSNRTTGMINTFSVILEIPFLFFADRIMKRRPLWTWLGIGLCAGAARYLLLSVLKAPMAIVLAQLLSIAHMACFEFFPFVWLGRAAQKELQASAQSVYQMITFGVARIASSLLGGAVADARGIPFVYALCGLLMLVSGAVFLGPVKRLAKKHLQ